MGWIWQDICTYKYMSKCLFYFNVPLPKTSDKIIPGAAKVPETSERLELWTQICANHAQIFYACQIGMWIKCSEITWQKNAVFGHHLDL